MSSPTSMRRKLTPQMQHHHERQNDMQGFHGGRAGSLRGRPLCTASRFPARGARPLDRAGLAGLRIAGGIRNPHRPVRNCASAAAFPRVVRSARLEPAAAPACAAGSRRSRALDAPHRADWRRQDAGGVPSEPGRNLKPRSEEEAAARPRPAHALRLAAEGACRRHPPQPRAAGGGDGASRAPGNAYGRHAGASPPAPAV